MPQKRAACVHWCVHGIPATTDNTMTRAMSQLGSCDRDAVSSFGTTAPPARLTKCSPPQIRPASRGCEHFACLCPRSPRYGLHIGAPCVLGLLGSRWRIATVFTAGSTETVYPNELPDLGSPAT